MSAGLIAQSIVNGVMLGLLYALMAVGFSLMYGVGRVLFCAHGEIYMVGAMGTFLLIHKTGMPFLLAVAVMIVSMGFLGLLLERFVFRRFYGNDLVTFMLSLALAMFIANLFLHLFGPQAKAIATPWPGSIAVGNATFALDKIVVISIAVAIIVVINWFLKNAKVGQAIRAVAQAPEAAAMVGINKVRSLKVVFFLGLGLASGAGALVMPIFYANTLLGTAVLMNAFIVVIIGGLGSFAGAVAGGLLLGLIQTFLGILIGSLTGVISFVIIIIFLIVRPQGLFGRE